MLNERKYNDALAAQKEAEFVARNARLAELPVERRRAAIMDFRGIREFLKNNNADLALTKINERLRVGSMMKAAGLLPDFDPASTQEIKELIEYSINQDNPNQDGINEAVKFIDVLDNAAVAEGVIDPRPKEDFIPESSIKNGNVFVRTNDGRMVARPIDGYIEDIDNDLEGSDRITVATKLRSELDDRNADFYKIANSWDRISAGADKPTAAGDMALIFNFMKMLDPGSTVREGEFANAQNSAGVPGRVRSLFNSVINGQRLNEEQRKDFFNKSMELFNVSKDRAAHIQDEIVRIGGGYGLTREEIVIDRGPDPDMSSVLSSGASGPLSPEESEELAARRAGNWPEVRRARIQAASGGDQ